MFWILFFVVILMVVAYQRLRLTTATAVIGAAIFIYGLFGNSTATFGLLLLIYAAVFIPLNVTILRLEWITRPALEFFRRALPQLSDSERTALEAGTVWWEGELFSGRPDWRKFQAIPSPKLNAEELAFLDGPVEQFCGLCNEWRITARDRDLSAEAWAFLKEQRFFGLVIPQQYGGLGFSAQAHSAILHRIASSPGGVTAATIVAVPNSLGPGELLLHYGTEEQKNHYLPRLASGEEIPCFGLTSPLAGSDAGSIPDRGVVGSGLWKGKETVGLYLTFDKRYITLAPVATVIGLAFRLYDPEKLLGDIEDVGISCALLPRDTPGLEIGRRHWPIDNPFMNGPLRGRDVFVPLDFLIGGAAMAGQGWRMLMECLAVGRSISLPSNAAGGATFAAYATGAYARIRRQFNLPIGAFEGVQGALARIAGQTYAINALRQFTATAVDLGEKPSVPSAITKLHCTAMARDVWQQAMDVHGGKGVMLGPSNYLARGFEATPIAITVEGANILTRSMIVFGQGAIRCHPYVLQEISAMQEDSAALALERFDPLLCAHVGHTLSSAARAFMLGLCFARLAPAPVDDATRRHHQRITRYSAALALVADAAMALLGAKLKLRESISARLGDVLSQLYIASAALKRHAADGSPREDLPLLDWVCCNAFHQVEQALDGVLRHLAPRPVAWLLRLLVFPLGMHARPANDGVTTALAELMQQPGPARARLTAGCYAPDGLDHPAGLLKTTLQHVLADADLEQRMLRSTRDGLLKHPHPFDRISEASQKGVITAEEAQRLRETWNLVSEVCKVDEFESLKKLAQK